MARAKIAERKARPPEQGIAGPIQAAGPLQCLREKQLTTREVPLQQLDVLAPPFLADDEVNAIGGEADLHTEVEQAGP